MLNAIVLTGGPCAGKSTLVALLEGLGHPVVHEKAAEVIAEGKKLPWVDAAAFRQEVLYRQLDSENALGSHTCLPFEDRGVYDGIAYCIATGVEVHAFFQGVDSHRYSLVFLLEGLPFWVNDGVRYEEPAFTSMITSILEQVYRDKGARVVRVPFMPVPDRLGFILSEASRIYRG